MSDLVWIADLALTGALATLVIMSIVAAVRKLPYTITEPVAGPVAVFAAAVAGALTLYRLVFFVHLVTTVGAGAADGFTRLSGPYLYWFVLTILGGALPLLFLFRVIRKSRAWLLRLPALALVPWLITAYITKISQEREATESKVTQPVKVGAGTEEGKHEGK